MAVLQGWAKLGFLVPMVLSIPETGVCGFHKPVFLWFPKLWFSFWQFPWLGRTVFRGSRFPGFRLSIPNGSPASANGFPVSKAGFCGFHKRVHSAPGTGFFVSVAIAVHKTVLPVLRLTGLGQTGHRDFNGFIFQSLSKTGCRNGGLRFWLLVKRVSGDGRSFPLPRCAA